ncbi:hypothetical protein VP01_2013g2 [Puccinia sorghi]|uniref:Uncharacterized protein n=1 Tax=Puccinia sorghi TaxID=27349 RepID=A0A0L6VB48_9BASI|nr:hypothetical protein VP01_2013g2 [Puccinia sorghi]
METLMLSYFQIQRIKAEDPNSINFQKKKQPRKLSAVDENALWKLTDILELTSGFNLWEGFEIFWINFPIDVCGFEGTQEESQNEKGDFIIVSSSENLGRNRVSGVKVIYAIYNSENKMNVRFLKYPDSQLTQVHQQCALKKILAQLPAVDMQHAPLTQVHQQCALKKILAQLPAVNMQHAPVKLPSKLQLFAYLDYLAQSLFCTVTVHQSLAESMQLSKLSLHNLLKTRNQSSTISTQPRPLANTKSPNIDWLLLLKSRMQYRVLVLQIFRVSGHNWCIFIPSSQEISFLILLNFFNPKFFIISRKKKSEQKKKQKSKK